MVRCFEALAGGEEGEPYGTERHGWFGGVGGAVGDSGAEEETG